MRTSMVVAILFVALGALVATTSVGAQPPVGFSPEAPSGAEDGLLHVSLVITRYAYLPIAAVAPCSKAPMLLSPANGSHLSTLVPTLSYMRATAPVSQSSIYIADNAGFNSAEVYGTSGGMLGPFDLKPFDNLNPATLYYWRVRDRCGSNYSPWSAVLNFTTGSGGVILAAPILTSPVSGTVGLMKPVTLDWSNVGSASGYQVHYGKVGSGGYSLVETAASSYALNYLDPSSTYEWWVVAFNSYAYGLSSPRWRFTTGVWAGEPPASEEPSDGVSTTYGADNARHQTAGP